MDRIEKIRKDIESVDREIRFRAYVKLKDAELSFPEKMDLLIKGFSDSYWSIRNRVSEIIASFPIHKTIEYLLAGLRSENENIAYWSSGTLAKFSSELVVNKLVEIFREGNSKVSHWAANALILMGRDILYFLRPYLKDSSSEVRFWVLKVISQFRDRTILPHVIPLLKDERWPIRKLAISIIGNLGDFSHKTLLMEAMQDSSWAVRKEAAEALARITEREQLEDSFWDNYRIFLEREILLQSPQFLDSIYEQLSSTDEYLVASAIKVASKFRLELLINYLREKVREATSFLLRTELVRAMVYFPEENFSEELIYLFENAKTGEENLKIEILRILYFINTDWSVELLLKFISDLDNQQLISFLSVVKDKPLPQLKEYLLMWAFSEDEFLAATSVACLGNFRDHSLINNFLELLHSPYPLVVKEALLALSKIGNDSLEPFVIPYLKNSNFEIRRSAIIAAKEMKLKSAKPILLEYLNRYGENERDIFFILEYLITCEEDEVYDYLINFFQKVNTPQIKYWLIHFFSVFPPVKVKDILMANLFGYSQKMTEEVLKTLYKLGFNLSFENLEKLLAYENNSSIRNLAVKTLENGAPDEAIAYLKDYYPKEKDILVKKSILVVLGKYAKASDIDFFIGEFTSSDWILRRTAMLSLANLFERKKLVWNRIWEEREEKLNEDQKFWLLKLAGEVSVDKSFLFSLLEKYRDNEDLFVVILESIGKHKLEENEEEKLFSLFDSISSEKMMIALLRSLKSSSNVKVLDKLEKMFDNYSGEVKFWCIVIVGNVVAEKSIELLSKWRRSVAGFLKEQIEKMERKILISLEKINKGDKENGKQD